jgi:hypothetical protein
MPETVIFLEYLWLKFVYMVELALPFLTVFVLILLIMVLSNRGD